MKRRLHSGIPVNFKFINFFCYPISSLKTLTLKQTDFNGQKKGGKQNNWTEEKVRSNGEKSATWGFKICTKNILLRYYQE
jgi:hypothetical protein